eukprot:TRINITY_DN10133_c0_g1_i7.p2 TRINITY_DN10133_c0_g1~~TRINITY_DN10133_c0_g1_i7.p2  ORF type:complete len:103 (-),score=13.91 TRINITY_DN10133_c0_g1_i7:91-399(-)
MRYIIHLFVSFFIINILISTVHAQSDTVPVVEDGFEEEYILDNVEERQQIGQLVLEAFRSEFKSSDPEVQKLYPYIRQIPAPPTPAEFLQMEQDIISNGNGK